MPPRRDDVTRTTRIPAPAARSVPQRELLGHPDASGGEWLATTKAGTSMRTKKHLFAAAILSVATLAGGVAVAEADTATLQPNPPIATGASRLAANGTSPSTFTEVAPCRIADTRDTTRMVVGAPRTFKVAGTTNFAIQGGKPGGCGIPEYATSVVVTLTSTQASGKGYLRAYASGTGVSEATALNYTSLTDLSVGATVPIGPAGMTALAYGANTHLVVDVTGYYEPPIAGIYFADGSVLSQSRLTPYSHAATGDYVLRADRSLSACSIQASSWSGYLAAAYASGSYIYVRVTQNGAAVNAYYHVDVTC